MSPSSTTNTSGFSEFSDASFGPVAPSARKHEAAVRLGDIFSRLLLFAGLVVAVLVFRIASAANHLHYVLACHRHNGVVLSQGEQWSSIMSLSRIHQC
jgi:hypothetical protein